ncbi:putative nitrogen Permease regulator of amino acid transport activity 3 [Lyophyllum shimeji]|uniref:Nitrogen permease regulator 3 n=1 Tax=Lyophyllum shimeji TaxID=47721 RepID=A0A9P3PS68_LYOSH|nr:putative nitrogen Permease regulator of amino acid transport activity 3 [Lyophyllum shimeji]
MAETLLAILLVTTSATEASLVYRWPPSPSTTPRLSRARPAEDTLYHSQLDNPWRASHFPDAAAAQEIPGLSKQSMETEAEYTWHRPDAVRERSQSFSPSTSHPGTGQNLADKSPVLYDYDHLFGYSADFLASLLCPQASMCHQKFELLVDNLAFIGHPVCAEEAGVWRFKPEKVKAGPRGRESRVGQSASASASPDSRPTSSEKVSPKSSWLNKFHFVLVLDIPDPSSSASGNVSKYFDIIYEQIAFTVTAVLFQEQVLHNFVETECDLLGRLKESCVLKGESFSSFVTQALELSSIAAAMKGLYEAVKASDMAYITIHNLPLEIQLPPYLDDLLHSDTENDVDPMHNIDSEDARTWGQDMSFGWKLQPLVPWKSLLLLDGHNGLDPSMNLRGSHVNPEDRTLVEGLIRFLETASVTLSLADMASLLDWDLETQVMPTVRWLVQHRRAKVVDIVHVGLKTVFTLPPKFERPLSELTAEFEKEFDHPSVPPLPVILAKISSSISKQTDNHFFASVVQDKELIPMYHDAVLWMLKRDMLITLHLRIRVVATRKVKLRVRIERENALARKAGTRDRLRRGLLQELRDGSTEDEDLDLSPPAGTSWLPLSPKAARRHSRRQSNESVKQDDTERPPEDDNGAGDGEKRTTDEDVSDELDDPDSGWDTAEDHLRPSMIPDPGRATPLQRRWLAAMSEGKDPVIVKRFQLINQYFDGKKSDDEILYRAEISRKQLREVLHHYEEYLQTFLHPS